jgi:ribosome-binding factor A
MRREIGHRVKLRYTPELVLELDESIERGMHIIIFLQI